MSLNWISFPTFPDSYKQVVVKLISDEYVNCYYDGNYFLINGNTAEDNPPNYIVDVYTIYQWCYQSDYIAAVVSTL